MIELSDKDLVAIANSRAWDAKRFKKPFFIMSMIAVVAGCSLVGYAVYLSFSKLPTEFSSVLWGIGMGYFVVYFGFFFIGSHVVSKQILKELKKERDK